MNNVSQLILATHNYENAHEVLPAGVVDAQGPVRHAEQGYHIGWIARILPYVEERTTYQHIDFAKSAYDKANLPVRAMTLSLLVCPSEAGSGPFSSYAACHHDVEAPIDSDNHGVFFLNSRVRHENILDGTTHTIFLGEKITRAADNDLGWLSGTRSTLRNTGTVANAISLASAAGRGYPSSAPWTDEHYQPDTNPPPGGADTESTANTDSSTTGTPVEDVGSGKPVDEGVDANGAADDDGSGDSNKEGKRSDENVSSTPVEKPTHAAVANTAKPGTSLYVGGFGSRHPGGVTVFAFGDGAVRVLTDDIDAQAYQQMGHRSDGQLRSDSP